MLPQVLEPELHLEGFDERPCRLDILEDAPVERAVAPPLRRELLDRRALAMLGRMRYSMVTSTGPRSPSISRESTGAGQCIDGDRSKVKVIIKASTLSFVIHRSGAEAARDRRRR